MDNSSLQVQFNNFLSGLADPASLAWVVLLLFMLIGVIAFRWTKWVVLTVTIFVAVLSYSGFGGQRLLPLLDQLRLYGRPFVTILLVVLLVPAVLSRRGWRSTLINPGLTIFFVFQIVSSMRFLLDRDFIRGNFGILSYTLIFTVLVWGLSRWLQSLDDARVALRCLVFAGIIFAVSSILQYSIDHNSVAWSGRFFGLSGNANHAGALLGVAVPASIYEAISTRRRIVWRVLIGMAVGLQIVLLVWTGSRTGFLVGVLGTALLFRMRLGRMILALIVCGAFVYIAFGIFEEAGLIASRLIDLHDTRSQSWGMMLQDFWSHPLIGISSSEAHSSENSYLLVPARIGIVGLIPFAAAMLLIWRTVFRLQRVRRKLGDDIMLADLVTAGILSLSAGALFEGFLCGTYNFPLFALFLYSTLATFLIDYADVHQLVDSRYAAHLFPLDHVWEQPVNAGEYSQEEAGSAYPVPQEQWG